VTEVHVCKQLAQGCYLKLKWPGVKPSTFWVVSAMLWPLIHHHATYLYMCRMQIQWKLIKKFRTHDFVLWVSQHCYIIKKYNVAPRSAWPVPTLHPGINHGFNISQGKTASVTHHLPRCPGTIDFFSSPAIFNSKALVIQFFYLPPYIFLEWVKFVT